MGLKIYKQDIDNYKQNNRIENLQTRYIVGLTIYKQDI